MLELCAASAIPLRLGNHTLLDVYGAEEAFVTGTFGGVTPVSAVDGRTLSVPGPVTSRIAELYRALIAKSEPGLQGAA